MNALPSNTLRSALFTFALVALALPLTAALAEPPEEGGAGVAAVQSDASGVEPVRIPRFARSTYVWQFEHGPYYGDVVARERHAAGTLVTPVGSFRLADAASRLSPELRAADRSVAVGARHYIVQLSPEAAKVGSLDELRRLLRHNGSRIADIMPVNAYVAKLDGATIHAVREIPGVLTVEPFHPAFKISPRLGRTPHVDADKAVSPVYELEILPFAGEDPESVAAQVNVIGGRVTKIGLEGTIYAELHRNRLAHLADIDGVRYVVEHLPLLVRDEKTTTTLQTGAYHQGAIPYHDAGVTGGGDDLQSVGDQLLMVLDSGIQLDAAELSDDRNNAGTAGVGHRKVRLYATTGPDGNSPDFGGLGDFRGCDAFSSGSFTHGHVVSATALGRASDVDPAVYCPLAGPGDPCGYFAFKPFDAKAWKLDGVAPGARLVFYDAQINNDVGLCADPEQNAAGWALDVGTLYAAPSGGSMAHAYGLGARTFNFSFGEDSNVYSTESMQIDAFLDDHKDAMAFTSAGNNGADINPRNNVPDDRLIGAPATMKNGIAVGSSFATSDLNLQGYEESRSFVSGVGPVAGTGEICATNNVCAGGRIQPTVMAPGVDVVAGALGPSSSFYCVSETNDQTDPVQCDFNTSAASTSFASAAAAGSGLLVRDYFAQGFYPDGTKQNSGNAGDRVADLSGALVKAVLVVSADFLNGGLGGNLFADYRPNNEQGWGRIQLDRVLPLEGWANSPTGLIVVDGGIPGGVNGLSGGVQGSIDALAGELQQSSFEICDLTQDLRIGLVWVEGAGNTLINNLDLEVEAPSGLTYFGNYSTDDDDRDGVTDATTEDCPNPFAPNAASSRDAAEWNLPACQRADLSFSPRDADNPVETVYLSPDYEGDGAEDLDPDDDNQIELGTWTVRVIAPGAGNDDAQGYALVIAGGVCEGSAVRIDSAIYSCNATAGVTVSEFDEPSDPGAGLDPTEIASRVTVGVFAPNDDCNRDGSPDSSPCDAESGTAFVWQQAGRCTANPDTTCLSDTDCPASDTCDTGSLQFVARDLLLTDGLFWEPGNGVLEVRHGDRIVVGYADETNGTADPAKGRTALSRVDCTVKLGVGRVTFNQFGQDFNYLVNGGCEKSPRDLFYQGYPDKHMDAGESLVLNYGFTSNEAGDLVNAEVGLRCVDTDADSPAGCLPGSDACEDPDRTNNPPCGGGSPYMAITNSPFTIGLIPPGTGLSANFNVLMAGAIPHFCSNAPTTSCTTDGDCSPPGYCDSPEVELVFEITAQTAGKTVTGVQVNRVKLDVDEETTYYSTDYPMGGVDVIFDFNGDEQISDPLTVVGEGCPPNCEGSDGRFETRQFAAIQVGGKNADIAAPWNFDVNDGNFRSGLNATTNEAEIVDSITNWGEDRNFNNILDWYCASGAQSSCGSGGLPDNPDPCPGRGEGVCISIEDQNNNQQLDQNWSTLGGCGWQTRAPGVCTLDGTVGCYTNAECAAGGAGVCDTGGGGQPTGGVWHTGTIGTTTAADCIQAGETPYQCQFYETVSGTTGILRWIELLVTPVLEKVNDERYSVEITQWGWNQAIDLADNRAFYTWEFDTDADALSPVDLFGDRIELNSGFGSYGAVSQGGISELSRGWSMFAPMATDSAPTLSWNGEVGNNREGKNSCYFEENISTSGLQKLASGDPTRDGLARPLDDDLNNGKCVNSAAAPTDQLRACNWTCSNDPGHGCNVNDDCFLGGTCEPNDVKCADPGSTCAVDGDCTQFASGRCVGQHGTCSLGGTSCNTNNDCPGLLNFCQNLDTVCAYACQIGTCADHPEESCNFDGDCTSGTCFISGVDAYVTPSGPIRNHDVSDWNGPDMRYFILEDIFGDTGERFQAAFGFETRDARPGANESVPGFGLSIDDVVIEWREFTLAPDQTDCSAVGNGSCAVVDVASSALFEGNAMLTVAVLEDSQANDCNFDGVVDTAPMDIDCNGDMIPDVPIKVSSPNEPNGEIFYLDRTPSACNCEYSGDVPLSSAYNAQGVVFIQQVGSISPFVQVEYRDLDDGTGNPCRNDVNSAAWGKIFAGTSVFLVGGAIEVHLVTVIDGQEPPTHGDGDGWADTNETVMLRIQVGNETDEDLEEVTAHLMTSDPKIDCVIDSALSLGPLGAGEQKSSTDGFLVRVADVERTGNCSVTTTQTCVVDADCPASESCDAWITEFSSDFTITLAAVADGVRIDSTIAPQKFTLELDLDAEGGAGPTIWSEGFEQASGSGIGGDFGAFEPENIDEFLHDEVAADGYRCQYHDPDWSGSNSYGNANCFPASSAASAEKFYWNINAPDSPDGGRSFSGTNSLYMGIYGPDANSNTTPVGVLDGIQTTDPIYLGWGLVCSQTRTTSCSTRADCPAGEDCVAAVPQLSWKHQASMMSSGYDPAGCIGARPSRVADSGVVQAQFADENDDPAGPWIKLEPFLNGYNEQAEDNYVSCFFDPIDDGNTEDTYCFPEGHPDYDPDCVGDFYDDPYRRLGPSSTCYPQWVYGVTGDTGRAFHPYALNFADGPGLEGATGIGTWVESKVDLRNFRGRRMRLRFVTTGLKASGGTAETWEIAFSPLNPRACDDGWWIDDITVTDALAIPAILSADVKPNDDPVAFPSCGDPCQGLFASLVADPPGAVPVPGHVIELSGAGSSVTACLDGTLHYRFWIDGNGNQAGGDPEDTLLRGFTDNPFFVDAPSATTDYLVEVRCSAAPEAASCLETATLTVTVNCPTAGGALPAFPPIIAPDRDTLTWGTSLEYDFAKGMLADVSSYFATDNGQNQPSASSFDITGDAPDPNTGLWYLFRLPGALGEPNVFCNLPDITWGNPPRDAALP